MRMSHKGTTTNARIARENKKFIAFFGYGMSEQRRRFAEALKMEDMEEVKRLGDKHEDYLKFNKWGIYKNTRKKI